MNDNLVQMLSDYLFISKIGEKYKVMSAVELSICLEQNQNINIFTYISQFVHTKVGFQNSNFQMACKLYEINQYSLLQTWHP